MKNIFTLLAFVFLSTQIFAQSTSSKKVEGFRTLEWGDKISDIKIDGEEANFIEIEKAKDGIYYILPNENLMIGNVLLTEIKYVFSKKDKKFYKVLLTGKKADVEEMNFIINYKYGDHVNEDEKDEKVIKQWIVNNVTFTLRDYTYNKFELVIESDWEAAEAYKKNTNVNDF